MTRRCILLLLVAGVLLSGGRIAAAEETAPAADPEERIVGRWKGIGMALLVELVFTPGHTYFFADDPEDSGTWEYRDGKYLLHRDEADQEATIDETGLMLITTPAIDDMPATPLRKMGEAPVANDSPSTATPTGEWLFAYTRKSSIPAAPPFDGITFLDGKVRLQFTPAAEQFEVMCQIIGGVIMFPVHTPEKLNQLMNYTPLGRNYPSVARMRYRWDNEGALVIFNIQAVAPFQCEWVFLKPDQFLKDDLSGVWATGGFLSSAITADFRRDGTLAMYGEGQPLSDPGDQPQFPIKYYRLWNSPFGKAMSICQLDREMQLVHVGMSQYRLEGSSLAQRAIECEYGEQLKLASGMATVWRRKSDSIPVSEYIPPEEAAPSATPGDD